MAERTDGEAGVSLSAEVSSENLRIREDDLQSGLDQLTELVLEALSLEDLLGQVSAAAVDAVPGADGVGVTLLRLDLAENRVQALAASHPFVSSIDAVQYDLVDEGPCITAAEQRQTIMSGSLRTDRRWPRFSPRVARLGVHSVLSLPMMLRDQTVVGVLNCYSRSVGAFDDDAARIGALFATPAAVAVHNSQVLARAQAHTSQLQAALVSRTIIDQAIGILRSRSGDTAEDGFARLKAISQSDNVKLSVVAERLVDEAVRRARARHAPG